MKGFRQRVVSHLRRWPLLRPAVQSRSIWETSRRQGMACQLLLTFSARTVIKGERFQQVLQKERLFEQFVSEPSVQRQRVPPGSDSGKPASWYTYLIHKFPQRCERQVGSYHGQWNPRRTSHWCRSSQCISYNQYRRCRVTLYPPEPEHKFCCRSQYKQWSYDSNEARAVDGP